MKIIDNYLQDNIFNEIHDYVHSTSMQWILSKQVNDKSNSKHHFQLIHNFIFDDMPVYDKSDKLPIDILSVYANEVKKNFEISRARANMFIKTSDTPQHMGFHKDIEKSGEYTLLFYLEDSNGYTNFDNGDKVESKKNRAVIFPADVLHETVSQTDILYRSNININFKDMK